MQMSLDGYIEGPQGDMTWVNTKDDEQWEDTFEMLETVDLVILGRVMFSDYRDFWKKALTNPDATPTEARYARFAANTPHIVFSTRMQNADWFNTSVIRGNVVEEIKKLKSLPGQDIYVAGGARLAATVVEGGVVDEYRLTVNPTILGSGKSFFQQQHGRRNLELISSKSVRTGRLIVRYR